MPIRDKTIVLVGARQIETFSRNMGKNLKELEREVIKHDRQTLRIIGSYLASRLRRAYRSGLSRGGYGPWKGKLRRSIGFRTQMRPNQSELRVGLLSGVHGTSAKDQTYFRSITGGFKVVKRPPLPVRRGARNQGSLVDWVQENVAGASSRKQARRVAFAISGQWLAQGGRPSRYNFLAKVFRNLDSVEGEKALEEVLQPRHVKRILRIREERVVDLVERVFQSRFR